MKPVDALDLLITELEDLFDPDGHLGHWDEGALQQFEDGVAVLVTHGYVTVHGTVLSRTAKGTELSALSTRARRRKLTALLAADQDPAPQTWTVDRGAWRLAARDYERFAVRTRIDVIEGITRALDDLGHVNELVSHASGRADAVGALMGSDLDLSEIQAQHVLDLQVARQTQQARQEIADELSRLRRRLDELSDP